MTPEQLAEMKRPISHGPQALWTLREQKQALLAEVQRLQKRLKVAEDVCVMYGWTGDPIEGDRAKALNELWNRWYHLVGGDFLNADAHPDLSDEEIALLAAQRDEARARTARGES
jgi:hypothetical protein